MRADELKASFLASVSHDLRTPITTVKGLLETLRREDAQWDEATRREFLDVAARESDRLARLVLVMVTAEEVGSVGIFAALEEAQRCRVAEAGHQAGRAEPDRQRRQRGEQNPAERGWLSGHRQ